MGGDLEFHPVESDQFDPSGFLDFLARRDLRTTIYFAEDPRPIPPDVGPVDNKGD